MNWINEFQNIIIYFIICRTNSYNWYAYLFSPFIQTAQFHVRLEKWFTFGFLMHIPETVTYMYNK